MYILGDGVVHFMRRCSMRLPEAASYLCSDHRWGMGVMSGERKGGSGVGDYFANGLSKRRERKAAS